VSADRDRAPRRTAVKDRSVTEIDSSIELRLDDTIKPRKQLYFIAMPIRGPGHRADALRNSPRSSEVQRLYSCKLFESWVGDLGKVIMAVLDYKSR
jgi:hypothetical protein